MELTPEIKAQLEEQKKQCIFCKLISGEMPAKTVFEDDTVIAMMDIYPALKGHFTYMLKEHYPIMPYIPADEFTHLFGLIPQLSEAAQSGLIKTGMTVFIANGGVAGQQSPHFLLHFLPRDKGDGFFNFMFKCNESLEDEKLKVLSNNFPIMMSNHFKRNPASWHLGNGESVSFLKDVYENSNVLYEDEKVLCVIPEKGAVAGHIEIYSKAEEKDITKVSIEDSAHLFFTASLAATLVFEGLGAQGTNIILKSGLTDDNLNGKLCIHVLPRFEEDSLKEMLWQPTQPEYDVDDIASQIKNNTWKVKYTEEKKEVVEKKESVVKEPTVIKIGEKKSSNPEDEIKEAIERMKN
jgi:histidine triad (HIT) family protein